MELTEEKHLILSEESLFLSHVNFREKSDMTIKTVEKRGVGVGKDG